MPVLSIAKPIADANLNDILLVLGDDQPMPPRDKKDMLKLAYTGDDPERLAAFVRLQHLTGVIADY